MSEDAINQIEGEEIDAAENVALDETGELAEQEDQFDIIEGAEAPANGDVGGNDTDDDGGSMPDELLEAMGSGYDEESEEADDDSFDPDLFAHRSVDEIDGFFNILDGNIDDSPLAATALVKDHPRTEFLENPELLHDEEHDPYLLVHLADLHLAPHTNTIATTDPYTGRLIRDLDTSKALTSAVDDILEQRPLPSACVIAGDIFDTWMASQDAIIDAAREIKRMRLAGIDVLSIAGNHDTPTQKKKTPAYVVLQHEFSDIAEDARAVFAYDDIEHVKSGNVEYVLLPHNACERGGFTEEDFAPVFDDADKRVLVVHGVAAGDASLRNTDEMKEIPITRWILDMDWDYIAFGHYHKPGWIPRYEGKAAYCGSIENTVISGHDVSMTRGPVYVDLRKDGMDKLIMHPQRIRKVMKLPTLDFEGQDVDAEELDAIVSELILDSDVSGAIVTHEIVNVPKSVIRTMKRRSFQSVNPEVLYIKTEITPLSEVEVSMVVNEETGEEEPEIDPETGEVVVMEEIDSAQNFKPLPQEIKGALIELVGNGTIRESMMDAVQAVLDDALEGK